MRKPASRWLMWRGLALILLPGLWLVGIEVYQFGQNVPRLRQSQERVAHTFKVIEATRRLELALHDAERAQRGFLITGEEAYLQPYVAANRKVPVLLARVKELTAGNPEQQRRWQVLEGQIEAKARVLENAVDARRSQGAEAARQLVRSNAGLDAMLAVDRVIDAAIAAESELLQRREERVAGEERTAAWISAAGAGLALLAMLIGGVLVVIGFRRIAASEGALRRSEEQLRLMISNVRDYAIFMLDPAGKVASWNQGAALITGHGSEEVLGKHFRQFYPPEELKAGTPDRQIDLAAREGSAEAEGWRLRQDGSRFWASSVLSAIRDEQGRLRGFANITRDLTERRAMEERIRQSQRLEAVGQLTGGIAHDFNNMLTVIMSSIGALQRRGAVPDAKESGRLHVMMQAARNAAALTRRLLAFSRQQPLDPKPLDLNQLVAGMSELLRRTLGERIGIETVLAAGLWRTLADSNELESAILNVAINARDATPGQGRLTIETSNVMLDDAYAATRPEVRPGQYAMLAISDSGSGMPPDIVAKVFDPFFTTKPAGQGSGLGLSQVYGFVKQSGGHISIYSEVGHGTTVKLYLPRLPGSAETPVVPSLPAAAQGGRATILVVEDHELVRGQTVDMLSELGYCVLAAADGASALEVLEAEPAIDLLFTDVGLPGGMTGRQFAEEARRRRPGVKVLFTTGYARNSIVHQGRLDPGVELILKPFTYADLAARVGLVLNRGAD